MLCVLDANYMVVARWYFVVLMLKIVLLLALLLKTCSIYWWIWWIICSLWDLHRWEWGQNGRDNTQIIFPIAIMCPLLSLSRILYLRKLRLSRRPGGRSYFDAAALRADAALLLRALEPRDLEIAIAQRRHWNAHRIHANVKTANNSETSMVKRMSYYWMHMPIQVWWAVLWFADPQVRLHCREISLSTKRWTTPCCNSWRGCFLEFLNRTVACQPSSWTMFITCTFESRKLWYNSTRIAAFETAPILPVGQTFEIAPPAVLCWM